MSYMDRDQLVGSDFPALPSRPQPEYRVSLTVAVTNRDQLWSAAATRLMAAPGMTLRDACDVIGPIEDPSIVDCLAALAKPFALPGCILDDFWIDSVTGCPPRGGDDIAPAVADHKLALTERERRAALPGRPIPYLALSLLPQILDTKQQN